LVDNLAKRQYNKHIDTNTQEQMMNRIEATIVAVAGSILVFGGVGGIELSENNEQLISSLVVAVLGLLACTAAYLGTAK
jgi:hypothetical protein